MFDSEVTLLYLSRRNKYWYEVTIKLHSLDRHPTLASHRRCWNLGHRIAPCLLGLAHVAASFR